MFCCGMVPVINKPTRVTRYIATAIDHMFTNSIINTEIKSAIIKTDISDHFPIPFVAKVNVDVNIKTEQHILKLNICNQSIKKLKQKLRDVTWNDIKPFDSANHSCNRFLQIFLSLNNECFPKIKIKLKPQKDFRPWITLGLRKSSKRKQGLHEKILKTRTAKSDAEYKTYKNMFETIKRKSKRNYIRKKYLDIKITLKNMEYYEGGNRQNKEIRVSSAYQTCNQQKRRDK